MLKLDTIAALSTAVGEAGIAIVRVSGPSAFKAMGLLFRCGKAGRSNKDFKKLGSHTVNYGVFLDSPSGEIIDEVLLLKMAAPNSYTREDVAEIHCHGGSVAAASVLKALFSNEVRPAEPGEFTKRAFLNGRIDLASAEAVMDLIRSHTQRGARAALDQLEGRLSEKVKQMRAALLTLLATLEVNLDYPEHDEEQKSLADALVTITSVCFEISRLTASFGQGRILKEGLTLVIAGRPNVGKSSLMNRISGQDRSIVTEIPGTTRDIVEAFVNIKGFPVRILDTAGIREGSDRLEKLGVERTISAIDRAELVLAVFDCAEMPNEEDRSLVNRLKSSKVPLIYAMNKADKACPQSEKALLDLLLPATPIAISAQSNIGIDELLDLVAETASGTRLAADDALLLTNTRHLQLLNSALENLREAEEVCRSNMTHDLLAFLVRGAWEELGLILGEGAAEELIDSIFSSFCLGK